MRGLYTQSVNPHNAEVTVHQSFGFSSSVAEDSSMQLTKELTSALHDAGNNPLEVVDPETNRVYLIVDKELHRRAMAALQQQASRQAIAEGLAQMESGQGRPAEEVFESLRVRMGFPAETG